MNTRHSGYVMPMNNYVDLEQYNKDTQFGPPLPASVPSANFPVILEQQPIQSYDVLTHNTSQNYPDVNNAYGNSCVQNYNVRKCPTNQTIRSFKKDGDKVTPTPVPQK